MFIAGFLTACGLIALCWLVWYLAPLGDPEGMGPKPTDFRRPGSNPPPTYSKPPAPPHPPAALNTTPPR